MELHVLGCAPASGNPGEACSGYLVEIIGTRILIDCGSGVVSSLLARDPRPVDAVVLSHRHFDHIADLIPLGYAHAFGALHGTPSPTVYAPQQIASLFEAGGAKPDHLPVEIYGERLDVGDAAISFRAGVHPGGSNILRIEAAGRVLCFSGDTDDTPILAEQARDADVLLCEASVEASRGVHLGAERAAARAREAGVKLLVLTHALASERDEILRIARAGFAGPVICAAPGLRVSI